jgi:mRNA surveillance protein pelota
MQLLSREKNIFELRIDHLEDLWVLSQFISQEDIIYATTKRKVAIGNDKTKQVIKIMYVELNSQKTFLETDLLRVQGTILNENEFTAVGQSHTLNFQVNDTIKIKKSVLHQFEEKQLQKSLDSKQTLNLGILLDKDDLIVFEFSEYGFKVLINEGGMGSKGGYATVKIDDVKEKYIHIEPLLKREYNSVILAGPGHAKDALKKKLDQQQITSFMFHHFEVDSSSIQKLILKIYESNTLQDSQIAREQFYIDTLLKHISSDSKFAYGYDNCVNAISLGGVDTFLLSTKFISKTREENTFAEIQALFTLVEQTQGSIVILHSKYEPGIILDGLGGIATILRY